MKTSSSFQRPTLWLLVLQTFSVFCILVGVNFFSWSHYCIKDASRSHRFSLSEQGSVLFMGIKQPAHIIIYCSPTSLLQEAELYSDLGALMNEYKIKAQENLTVEYVDPARNLTRAREVQGKYKFNANENVVIIDYLEHSTVIPIQDLGEYQERDGKKYLVAFRGEQVLNGALIGLSQVPLKKIYFLQGHGEMIPGSPPLEIIGRYLQWQNVQPALLNLSSTLEVPEDAGLVVIAGASIDLSEAESTALGHYWEHSGRLLVLLDPTADTPLLNKVLQQAGISPRHDRVVRTVSSGIGTTTLYDVTGMFIPGSEFTKQFLNLNILFLGMTESLALAPSNHEDRHLQVRPLIEALYDFFGSSDAAQKEKKEILFQAEKDTAYPVVIAAMADRGALHDDRVAVHAARMVVVGNCDFIKDPSIEEVGLDFFSSSINGLIDRISLAGNTAKMKAYFTLNLSDEIINRIALWTLFLIPSIVALLCSLILWKRRN
ncbi:MAG: GldG family protein [Chthoniobacterales bacterium]|nr:GldG family protein [Chthoniobacterales bacterium]